METVYKGEKEIYDYLKEKGKGEIKTMANELRMKEDMLRRAAESLEAKGVVIQKKLEKVFFVPTKEFEEYINTEFPEYSVYEKAVKGKSIEQLNEREKRIGIKWAKEKGMIKIEKGKMIPIISKEKAIEVLNPLYKAYKEIKEGKQIESKVLEELKRRKLIDLKKRNILELELTGKELIIKKTFGLNVLSKFAPIGKAHPLTALMERIREIFVEMGFEEMDGPIVESSFWNFDALFQPQDHPARELADTFYLPATTELPEDKELIERVKKAHEKGWKYQWIEEEAKKKILRTHTTALSARYLSKLKKDDAKKFFAVGRVFRNEATDYKHLAEFHQAEGIVAWKNATFRDLLGILKEFYKKLGFEKIRFRPSYFPYTEPSLEIEIYYEPKKQWMELGGAGIFRPEVSQPLCGIYPVLAWGLSLERPLMMLLDIDDIRVFYKNDINWLREYPEYLIR